LIPRGGREAIGFRRVLLVAAGTLAVVALAAGAIGLLASRDDPGPAGEVAPPEVEDRAGVARDDGPLLAVTIDDVPWTGRRVGREELLARTDRLLEALAERNVPAVGFVTCGNLLPDGGAIRLWHRAGLELGNHTWSHLDLNGTDPEGWLADAVRCEDRIEALTRARPRWFRHPMLHQGATVGVRDSVARALATRGYEVGHVTIDNSEWLLGAAYDRALRAGDGERAAEIGAAYVEHLVEASRHFREVARERFGRETAQVLLLHANSIASDWAGAAIDALVAEGFTIATLEEALADPVFALEDGYVGPRGLSWLYRVEPAVTDDPWDRAAEEEIRDRFADR
jgi:peptidoglycan/xylan/chitin deacetylase (PgdA/CDA1 family)